MLTHLKIVLSVVLCLVFLNSQGQSFYKRSYTTQLVLSAGTGTASYFGDLIDDGKYNFRPSLSAGVRYSFYDRFSVGGDITYFRLAGIDANYPTKARRNLSFKSNNVELNGTLRIALFKSSARFYMRRTVNPYIYGGVGLLWFQPRAEYEGKNYNLRSLETEGIRYSPFVLNFPAGVGVKFKLNAFIDITLDGGYRWALTDYLDDVSSEYPDPASRFQPQGVHGPSQVTDPYFPWEDDRWSGLPLQQFRHRAHTAAFDVFAIDDRDVARHFEDIALGAGGGDRHRAHLMGRGCLVGFIGREHGCGRSRLAT